MIPYLDDVAAGKDNRCAATLKGHSSYVFSLALAGDFLYSGDSQGEVRIWDRNLSSSVVVVEGCSGVKSILVFAGRIFTAHQDHKIRVWRIGKRFRRYKLVATLPTVGDRCMRVFSPENYVQIRRHVSRTWVNHVDAVSALASSRDGKFICSVSWDRTLKLWRTSDFKVLESVQNAHDDAINAVVLSENGVVFTASADKTIKIWKREKKYALMFTLKEHKSGVNALALKRDGSVLYSGSSDGTIIAWGKEIAGAGEGKKSEWRSTAVVTGHEKAVLCLAVVDELLLSGSADGTVRIWRSGNSYCCVETLQGHNRPVKSLTADFDGDRRSNENSNEDSKDHRYVVYSGGMDSDIRVWQITVSV
ncbi:hypothetical protein M569_01609 [Genlisea aurea]|uniref:Uncharacterized protein n=1 Tax=Genlisea aurea TaxID=192259 RepID=S8D169_9LAMI|nr:hypothetical protein M569_01609 [Genlisea aurea]